VEPEGIEPSASALPVLKSRKKISMTTGTSDDAKSVSPICSSAEDVDAALAYVVKHGDGKPMFPEDWAALHVLADEVHRLRVLNHEANESITAYAEVERDLLTAKHVMAMNFGNAQLEIAWLHTKLARVEALPALWREPDPMTGYQPLNEFRRGFYEGRNRSALDVENALRDQP
jgi:hypothetical protein